MRFNMVFERNRTKNERFHFCQTHFNGVKKVYIYTNLNDFLYKKHRFCIPILEYLLEGGGGAEIIWKDFFFFFFNQRF
jgi:hypothetical protein